MNKLYLFTRQRCCQVGTNFNRTIVSASDDLKIQYLKESLSEFDKPNHFAKLVAKNPDIQGFKRSAVLVPISVRLEKNEKGHRVQKSYFTLSKRTEKLKSFKGTFHIKFINEEL